MQDREQMFTGATTQVVTASGNSTDAIDQLAARNLGAGEPVRLAVNATAISGTAPTVQVKLVGADSEDFATNKITIFDSGTLSGLVAGKKIIDAPVPSHTPKRYLRLEYIVGGTTPSFTLIAGLQADTDTGAMV